jgi:hypothetical protein
MLHTELMPLERAALVEFCDTLPADAIAVVTGDMNHFDLSFALENKQQVLICTDSKSHLYYAISDILADLDGVPNIAPRILIETQTTVGSSCK